jgi:hypothetical protein
MVLSSANQLEEVATAAHTLDLSRRSLPVPLTVPTSASGNRTSTPRLSGAATGELGHRTSPRRREGKTRSGHPPSDLFPPLPLAVSWIPPVRVAFLTGGGWAVGRVLPNGPQSRANESSGAAKRGEEEHEEGKSGGVGRRFVGSWRGVGVAPSSQWWG